MTCQHLYQDTGLQCTRDEHEDRGHVYVTGSWVHDRHWASSHE